MSTENESEIFGRLGRIERITERIDERTKSWADGHADHEHRIRDLERDNDKRKGFLAAAASIGGTIGAGITWLVNLLSSASFPNH